MRSPLTRVWWPSPTSIPWARWYSPTSGARSASAERGSSVSATNGSLATSDDCSTTRAGWRSTSTS